MKFCYLIFFSLLFSIFSFFNYYTVSFLSVDYYYYFNSSFMDLNLSFSLGLDSFIFMFMVLIVTFLVSVFSEIYLEHYFIKKYIFLMVFFFISMMFLIFSNSWLLFLLGWDLLGLSSVLLIMFYPNETSIFNSIFTMFFNRLGDVFLLFYICMSLTKSFLFSFDVLDNMVFFFIMICIMTKSAQFPFSNWLPLAMSAPTPISAMVHSSTLVTAGVFLMFKFSDFFFFLDLIFFFSLVSFSSFFLGGFMANVEKDFKKVIAFSTMSQISMMIFLLSFNFKFFGILHMIFHAFFKSLLFICSGLSFFFFYMDQNKLIMSLKNFCVCLKFLIFFCLFSMSGLIFSMSFYSKDFIIEWSFSNLTDGGFFFLMMFGSIMTICYCKLLLKSSTNFSVLNKYFCYKNFSCVYSMFGVVLVFLMFSIFIFFFGFYCFFSFLDLLAVSLAFFSFILMSLNFNFNYMSTLCFFNFFFLFWMKFIYSIMFKKLLDFLLDLNFFFKIYYFKSYNIFKSGMFLF